jgi:glycosyltransferase involved in cell wall biosynthesis
MNTVSVIIPAFNAERTLRETLDSVRAQTTAVQDIIVVDDGSTDNTAAIAQSISGVTVIRQNNAGPAAAVNAGLQLAQGNYIGLLDADDLWRPHSVSCHLRQLNEQPHLDVSLGWVTEFICPSMSAQDAASFRLRPDQAAWLAGASLVKKQAFEQVGPYDPAAKGHGWIDWVDRARNAGVQFGMANEIVLQRRLHKGSLSTSEGTKGGQAILSAVRLALARRRAGGAL